VFHAVRSFPYLLGNLNADIMEAGVDKECSDFFLLVKLFCRET